eukprot:s5213_g2.t1
MVEGSAFTAVSRLDGAKLRVKSLEGVTLLVETLGGQWGSTELEERYEFFERAIYGTTQRNDESNDSFISRMEGYFTELIARKTSLEEIQAYVLLRQSTLPAEDKKKILLEHGGKLSYPPVVKSLRLIGSRFFHELIGSRFFHEFQTGKAATKTKVYDTMITEEQASHGDDGHERVVYVSTHEDDEIDPEYVEALVAQDDPDAQLVQSFETEFEDFVQETPELHQAMVSYVEARQRLLDKRKTRGFWPPKGGSGGGKQGYKGKYQKGKGGRQGLLARIARSTCRLCNQRGHWKAERPLRQSSASGTSPSPTPPTAASANVAVPEGPLHDESEIFLDGDFSDEDSDVDAECFTAVEKPVGICIPQERFGFKFNNTKNQRSLQTHMQRFLHPQVPCHGLTVCHVQSNAMHQVFPASVRSRVLNNANPVTPNMSCRHRNRSPEKIGELPVLQACDEKSTFAILDTGASRCIIGSNVLQKLLCRLPENIRNSLKERPSQIKFRFGNNQTLTSQKRVHFPFWSQAHERVWLGVEAANAIMGTLTLVLQLSMSLIEMNAPLEEEEMPPVLSQQLESMCQELTRLLKLWRQPFMWRIKLSLRVFRASFSSDVTFWKFAPEITVLSPKLL